MQKINRFGIVSFKKTDQVFSVIQRIADWATENSVPLTVHPCLRNFTDLPVAVDETAFITASDAIVSLGGDGTFLSVAHLCRFTEKPVVGVNLGGLGFLTDISPDAIEENLSKIRDGNYRTISRMVLDARLSRNGETIDSFHALNDVFINRINTPKLTSVSAWYGNDFITDFYADGIIVATPNGSTAYSLSAGGPIVEPTVQAFLLTPICPHSLTERPIILPSDREIRLVVNEKNPDLLLSIDGLKSVRLQSGDQVTVSYGGVDCNLMQLAEHSYFSLLRRKLDWGKVYKKQDGDHAS
ncbi:MAG: NAD(+)/NADH kinase [Chitinispirillaceae bacterium]|nr:NAD(+)/NADH kinase [Chitinispirillaceae bacterium]